MERLLKYFVPQQYQLNLQISREQEEITGTVVIDGEVMADEIKFHAVDMEILEVSYLPFLGQNREQVENENQPKKHDYIPCEFQYDGETLVIPLKTKMYDEIYSSETVQALQSTSNNDKHPAMTLQIKFKTKINHNMQGCYMSTYQHNGKERKLVTTQFESHYAREAFPCIDEPAAKAVFNLSITVPDFADDDVILANTEITNRSQNQFIFAPTPRMSTYLLAWVIGPLKSISATNQHGVKVASYAALNQSTSALEFANEVACRALDYYDEKFGIKYPLSKLDQVALPDFEAGAMENWGLVTYRESCMLAESDAAVDTKVSVATTVTHELSHQWFGDLVTMEWWNDLWLNESFATIMEYYATDALYPELNAWQDFYTGDCVAALRRDSLRGVQAVKQQVYDPAEIATLFDGAIVYAKGARLVLMLIHLLGEQNFLRGVHDYFEQHQYQNTIGDDLWKALQPYADFNVKDFMHAWISQPGYPALRQQDNSSQAQSNQTLQQSDDAKQTWNQQRFLIDGSTDDTKWPLPEVKDDMSGHYMIDLSEQSFAQKLGDFENLDLEQRLRLLIDRMMLAKARQVPSESLVEILPKFTNEGASVWSILLDIINDLKLFFPPETEVENTYREFLRQLIHTRIHEVGVKSQPNDDSDEKRLRNILTVIARFARDPEIIAELASQYQSDLSKIDAELRGNILMAKMLSSEAEIFPELLQKYNTETDPEIKSDLLAVLAAARDEANIRVMIGLLKDSAVVRPQDHLYLLIYLLRNPKAKSIALDWLYDNWDYVEKIAGEKSLEDYVRCAANYINTTAEAERFNDFFVPKKANPILRRSLEMAQVGIDARLALIASESAAVQAKVRTTIIAMEK